MEADAVPEAPRFNVRKKKKNTSDASKSTDQQQHTSGKSTTVYVHGDVYKFNRSNNLHFGHVINVGIPKSSKSSKGKKVPKKDLSKPPLHISAMNQCLDLVTPMDVERIRTLITCSWSELAGNIKTHANHVNSAVLPHSDAVQEVLNAWIEEHCDSALVAILVEDLWNIDEFKAASSLAEAHFQR